MIDVIKIKKNILDLAIHGDMFDSNSLKEPCDIEDLFDLPIGWKWCKLGAIEKIERGGSPRPIKSYITDDKNGVNWIKIGDVDKNGKYIENCKEKIIKDGVRHSRYVYPGDFLLTNSMSFGRPYITKIEGCIHDGWLVIHNDEKIINKDYLYYYLFSNFAYNQFCNRVSGSTVENLNIDRVKDSYISIPPIEEQEKIVKKIEEFFVILDRIDELQKKYENDKNVLRKKIIEAGISGKLTEQLESDGDAKKYYNELNVKVEDDESEIKDSWAIVKITSVCDITTGTSISEDIKKKKYVGYIGGYSYIGTKDVGFDHKINYNNGVRIPFDEEGFRIAEKGSILLCIEGGSAGRKIGIIDENVCYGNKLCKFYSTSVNQLFLYYYLQSDTFKESFRNNVTGLIDGVSIGTIKKMTINIPPLAEQERIVNRIFELLSNL